MSVKAVPGHRAVVSELPPCDMCGTLGHAIANLATWDAPTVFGSWAYMCDSCAAVFAAHPGATGVGIGQRLVAAE